MLLSHSAKHPVTFCAFRIEYLDKLLHYLDNLSPETKRCFGPHPFSKKHLMQLFKDTSNYILFVAIDNTQYDVIAYTIVKLGWVDFDVQRLSLYKLLPELTDCTIAPSVADKCQSQGVGSEFFNFVLNRLRTIFEIKRFILWGGVQSDNDKAIGFYKKFKFKTLGEFEHNGKNFDMIRDK